MNKPETTPVIVGVGEYKDRPENVADALEPVALMERAVQAACADSSPALLQRIDSVELVGLISWRYKDPVALLCQRLGIDPASKANTTMGGETPVRLVHEAALRISRGEQQAALIVGGEAMHSRRRSRKEKVELAWTPQPSKEESVRYGNDTTVRSELSNKLGINDPVHMYPLYEMAVEASWQQTPAEGREQSAKLWEQFAQVAADNPYAWIQTAPDAAQIAEVNRDNRMINWPYSKLTVANMVVNQASAVIVTSLAAARAAGVPEERIVHIWGGAAAAEPADYLERDGYDRSSAQSATLARATEIAGGDAQRFKKIELYSCFPVVPKMALRELNLDPASHAPTVTGGLTFFGGPLNNYMGHAVCAMVRELRKEPGELGLLYAQGGIVSKHHTLVVSTAPAPQPLVADYSVQAEADRLRGPVPEVVSDYQGPATIETYTVLYGADGVPIQGVVILRTAEGARTMARVIREDESSLALLLDLEKSAVGSEGHVRIDTFGLPRWESGPRRDISERVFHFARVEREGPLTIVTINRPDVMNSLTPAANAELAEIFDDFASDPAQWVAIITGAGERAFSAGNDLKFTSQAMARGESIAAPLTGFAGLTSRYDLNKPVIAAVNGTAMGGGFEIALACDLIVASDNAIFALPEPRVGLAALAGGLLRLPRQIGLKQAMGMILTGRRVSASEGQSLGFVNEVTTQAELMTVARRWAAEIIECSPASIRASKEIVRRGLEEPTLADADKNQNRYAATRALYRSPDLREGPLAFAQKRKPRWAN